MSDQYGARYPDALMNTFGSPRLVLTKGEGPYVWDDTGKRYLDLLGGIAVNVLGHGHPALVDAVTTQLQTLGHVSNFFATGPQVELAEKLLALLGHDGRVFLTNSGTEANEAALKLTRRTGRTHLVAAEGSFHGRTMGALALTSKAAYREPFEPLPGHVTFVPYGDVAALEAAVTDETAAVVLEPLQGEAGVVVPPVGYLEAAGRIAHEHGALLWLDEVQTGVGRTGHWFAHHDTALHGEVVPDVVTVAKGLGGGFPIGACIGVGEVRPPAGPGQPRLHLRRQPGGSGRGPRGAPHAGRRRAAGPRDQAGGAAEAGARTARGHRGPWRRTAHRPRPRPRLAGRACRDHLVGQAGRGRGGREGLHRQRLHARPHPPRASAGADGGSGRRLPGCVADDPPGRPTGAGHRGGQDMTRHFLRDDDLTPEEQHEVLQRARYLKGKRDGYQPFQGAKSVALIFDKPTLRTQASFSAGVAELGGSPMVVDGNLAQIGTRESISDTAKVLGRQVAAIVWRTYGQERIEEMAAHAGVPVVNALTDEFHPCQLLADLLTVTEHKGDLAGLKLAFLGDAASNMSHSYLLACALAGMHVVVSGPAGYAPDPAILDKAEQIAAQTGGSARVDADAVSAVSGADVVATDTWVSMGKEGEADSRVAPFLPYALDAELLGHAKADAIVLHCLPAYRGKEIAAEVIDGPQSVVWDEAENRLHAQKALLSWLLEHRRDTQPEEGSP